MTKPQLTFIGFGNMAKAIANGLDKTHFKAIKAADPSSIKTPIPGWIEITTDNKQACRDADCIVLAVKPQVINTVCEEISQFIAPNTLIISIAAGTTLPALEKFFVPHQAIVRCMPNTPAMVNQGASALVANPNVNSTHKALAQQLFEGVGITEWLEKEELIDAVTALSGSGPAYVFLFLEALIDAAQELGLPVSLAKKFALQTVGGACQLATQSEDSIATLRKNVTSPGGTTAAALGILEELDFKSIINKAMVAATNRAKELGN